MSNDRRNGLRIIIPSPPSKKVEGGAQRKIQIKRLAEGFEIPAEKFVFIQNILPPSSVMSCVFDYDKWYLYRHNSTFI
ncbi:hypothetical protein TNCV_3858091 [Trichonephila clavipes]|nr:hypothetical protein TNCV_3858091 [Trichonephila clavipes]